MPLAVYVLGMAIFAPGTSELMLAGLLPGTADDLGVSVPDAGRLISAFAIGMLAGAPMLAVLTRRRPHRRADGRRAGVPALYAGFGGLVVVSVALALTAGSPAPTVALVFLLGLAGFATNPTLNSRAFGMVAERSSSSDGGGRGLEDGGSATLVAAGNVAAFNIGITAGPWLGGLAIDAGAGLASTAWIGAALGALALGAVTLGQSRGRTAATAGGRTKVNA